MLNILANELALYLSFGCIINFDNYYLLFLSEIFSCLLIK